MARSARARWGVYVHDPAGDMGYGVIVGPFYDVDAAERKADQIRAAGERQGREVEPIVLPVLPGGHAAGSVAHIVNPQ